MKITKEQADKVIAALEIAKATLIEYGDWWPVGEPIAIVDCAEALSIMRGLAEDAEPVAQVEDRVLSDAVEMLSTQHEWLTKIAAINLVAGLYGRAAAVLSFDNANPTSPQAAQTDEREAFEAWPKACKEIIDRCVAPDMYPQARALLDLAVLASRAGRKG